VQRRRRKVRADNLVEGRRKTESAIGGRPQQPTPIDWQNLPTAFRRFSTVRLMLGADYTVDDANGRPTARRHFTASIAAVENGRARVLLTMPLSGATALFLAALQ
jgi:hypothetical protein